MLEIDLELRRAHLVHEVIHVDLLDLAEIVDLLDERLELVHGIHAERLTDDFLATGPPDRGLERVVGIGVGLDEIELDLGCNDGHHAVSRVHVEDPPQHLARSDSHRAAILFVAIVDDAG